MPHFCLKKGQLLYYHKRGGTGGCCPAQLLDDLWRCIESSIVKSCRATPTRHRRNCRLLCRLFDFGSEPFGLPFPTLHLNTSFVVCCELLTYVKHHNSRWYIQVAQQLNFFNTAHCKHLFNQCAACSKIVCR
jgi:hypothetical protein